VNQLLRTLKKNPALVIGTAAVIGLALGTGAIPLPAIRGLAPAPASPAAPATPPPPPDPLDAY